MSFKKQLKRNPQPLPTFIPHLPPPNPLKMPSYSSGGNGCFVSHRGSYFSKWVVLFLIVGHRGSCIYPKISTTDHEFFFSQCIPRSSTGLNGVDRLHDPGSASITFTILVGTRVITINKWILKCMKLKQCLFFQQLPWRSHEDFSACDVASTLYAWLVKDGGQTEWLSTVYWLVVSLWALRLRTSSSKM